MSLPMRRAREVYRIYDELEYISGAEGADGLASDTPGAGARRLSGPAAATVAVLAVGGTSLTLLVTHRWQGPAGKDGLADASRSAAPGRVASGAEVGHGLTREQLSGSREQLRGSREVRPRRTRRAPRVGRVPGNRATHARAVEMKGAAPVHAREAMPVVYRTSPSSAAGVPMRAIPAVAGGPPPRRRSEFGFERG